VISSSHSHCPQGLDHTLVVVYVREASLYLQKDLKRLRLPTCVWIGTLEQMINRATLKSCAIGTGTL